MTYYIKQLYILTLLLVATAMTIIPVELQARSSGPALNGLGDRTGSPLSGATCAACHSGGSFTVEALISVVDLSGSPVESFVAGETYMITVLADTTSGSPNAYGFQLTLLDDTNKTIGAFSTPSAGSGLVSLSNQVIWEHTTPSASGIFTVLWDAPVATSSIDIYAIVNAVNGNGGTSGDMPSATALFSAELDLPADWIFVNGFE